MEPRVALIDADILVYQSAYRCQTTVQWDDEESTPMADFVEAVEDFDASVQHIVQKTGASHAILALTDSAREANFRRSVWPDYKCHRETKDKSDGRPLLYAGLRSWVREQYETHQKRGIEADDTVGIIATMEQAFTPIICSIDKDLDTVPGWHFNWNKSDNGVYYVTEDEAARFHLFQTMTGDSTDNYPGIPGIGQVRATRYMEQWSELPLWAVWEEIVALGEERGVTEDFVLSQARCAYILHATEWDIQNQKAILWTPPREEDA